MTLETMAATAKGHVKVEFFNEKGEVYLTREKKNLVVQNANAIVANVLANPAKTNRVNKTDIGKTGTSVQPEGYIFDLSIQAEKLVPHSYPLTAANSQKVFSFKELANLKELKSVAVGSTTLVIDKDVRVQDAEAGTLVFEVAPTSTLIISANVANNQYGKVIDGTEVVKVAGVAFKRSNVASDANKTYKFDAKRGIVIFETYKEQVEVTYAYATKYSLGFMGLGGKPAGWQDFKPVEFGLTDKLRNEMNNEFTDARMPIQFPAQVTQDAIEIQPSIVSKPVPIVPGLDSGKEITILALPDTNPQLEYAISNMYNTTGVATARLLYEVEEVKNVTQDKVIAHTVTQNDLAGVKVKFTTGEVAVGDKVTVKYTIKLDNAYLSYQLAQAPAIQLVAVKFRRSLDPSVALAYNVQKNGLVVGEGDVWISDSATGQITFAETLTAQTTGAGIPAPWEEEGHLQVEYRINSGTTVRFVAEFPQGIPGPALVKTDFNGTLPINGTTIVLPNEIAADKVTGILKAPKIYLNTSQTPLAASAYTIGSDKRTITLTSYVNPSATTPVRVEYEFWNDSADIYQVAMFDGADLDPNLTKMFNISGIGPITKDRNTGMRVTWAVTF